MLLAVPFFAAGYRLIKEDVIRRKSLEEKEDLQDDIASGGFVETTTKADENTVLQADHAKDEVDTATTDKEA